MAIVSNNLATAGGTGTSLASASISPASDALILAVVSHLRSGLTPTTPTLSGNGLTWVQIGDSQLETDYRVTLFRAMGSSPSAGAVTADFGGESQSSITMVIDEFTGVDTSGTNGSGATVQSAGSSAPNGVSIIVTLSSFADAANNAAYGCFGLRSAGATITQGTGFSLLGNATDGSNNSQAASEFRVGEDTSVDWTWDTSVRNCALAVEIAIAPGAPAGGYARLVNHGLVWAA